MSSFIRQEEVNLTIGLREDQEPLLQSLSEMDELPCLTDRDHSQVTEFTVMSTCYPAREFGSTKTIDKVLEGAQNCSTLVPFPKEVSKNLYKKHLNSCKDPCRILCTCPLQKWHDLHRSLKSRLTYLYRF